MRVTCPSCHNTYELDANVVPRRRLRVRCPGCGRGLRIDGTEARRRRRPPRPDDRMGWSSRLARALVSDILVYHRERRDAALAEGRLLVEFARELGAAWETFKAQVGDDVARHAPVFREAVNEILADGEPLLETGSETG